MKVVMLDKFQVTGMNGLHGPEWSEERAWYHERSPAEAPALYPPTPFAAEVPSSKAPNPQLMPGRR